MDDTQDLPITESWLAVNGFKWHQFDRQPDKHWLLWLGGAIATRGLFHSIEDLGIEVAQGWWKNRNGDDVGDIGSWFCWLRGDTAGRYSRLLHIRHIRTVPELVRLIEALTGQAWAPANVMFGVFHTPERAARLRQEREHRLDHRLRDESYAHREIERDPTMGGALPEHLEAHEKAREAKRG